MTKVADPTTLMWDGTSPLLSNVSARGVDDPRSYVEFVDLITDASKRIRKRPGIGTNLGSIAGVPITALHEFERVNPTTGAVTYHILGTIDGGGYIYKWNGAGWTAQTLPITISAGAKPVFCNFANRCFYVNGIDAMLVFDGTTWRQAGIDTPAAAATYTLSTPYITGSVSVTEGSPTVNGSGATTWVTGGPWNGLPMTIDGEWYTISTVAAISPGILTLEETYKSATASGVAYAIYTGLQSWGDDPPKYSWAWYNPTTGHVSNRAPITEITEKNVKHQTITLTIAGSAANTTAYNAGYTQIKIFRTAADGNQLCAIDVIVANNNAGSSIVFAENTSTYLDKFLTRLTAPITTNAKPPTAMSSITSYLGRLCGLRPSDPTNTPPDAPRWYFSAITGEIPFGVPEESFPSLFARSGVGQPKGLLTIGSDVTRNSLVIQAADGNYSIEGYDNRTFTDPYLLPGRTSGGFLHGAINNEGTLVQMYRDKRLLADADDMARGIQDKLNAIGTVSATRLVRFTYENANYLLVSIASGGSDQNKVIAFDYDNGRIDEWSHGFSAASTVHAASGALELWTGTPAGAIYKLFTSGEWRDAGADFAPYFKTATIDFGASRKRLALVRIYVGPTGSEALTWKIRVYRDEDTTGEEFTFFPAPDQYQSAQGRELVYPFEKPLYGDTWQAKVTFPTANQDLYIERFEMIFSDASVTSEDE